jgi:hypothetical protein
MSLRKYLSKSALEKSMEMETIKEKMEMIFTKKILLGINNVNFQKDLPCVLLNYSNMYSWLKKKTGTVRKSSVKYY